MDIEELKVNSGHSTCRQWRFASAAYGPFAAAFVIFFAKDMYVLKLGADANRAGTIASVWAVGFPMAYVFSGHLMDRHASVLEKPGWGRRAPWFASHLIPLALICFLLFLPGLVWVPAAGSVLLDVWLAGCLLLSAWCLPVLFNAIESARAEIYPFKEERVAIEGMTKFIGLFASASGILPQFILWTNATLLVRIGVSSFIFVCMLMSLGAVPVFKDAVQPYVNDEKASLWESAAVLKNSPMLHATLVRFWHSAADTTYVNFSIYYVTFVAGFDSVDRAKWMTICGICVASLEFFILVPFWSLIWTRNVASKVCLFERLLQFLMKSMRGVCCTLHVLGAIVPPLLLRFLPKFGISQPWEWVVYSVALRFFYSPQAFFRTNSYCWVVDEDCQRAHGRRREAIHAGVVKLFEDEGRALAFAIFLGLGWAGLQTENCELHCADMKERDDCVRACDRRDILRQPGAVPEFINAVLTYLVPCFGLMCAFHIWRFPIHGNRLTELQHKQVTVFKKPVGADPDILGSQCETSPLDKTKPEYFH